MKRLTNSELKDMLVRSGALVFGSGENGHNENILHPRRLFICPLDCYELAKTLVLDLKDNHYPKIDVFAGTAESGAVLAQATARLYTLEVQKAFSVYAERQGDTVAFCPDFAAVMNGKKVAIVSDFDNVDMIEKTVAAAYNVGANVTTIAMATCAEGFGAVHKKLGVPFVLHAVSY